MRRVMLGCLILLAGVVVGAQEPLPTVTTVGELELVDVVLLDEIAPGSRADLSRLSPDGSRLAWWYLNDVCVHVFATAETTCVESPVPVVGNVGWLDWVWDNRTLAVARFGTFQLLDTDTGTWERITPDDQQETLRDTRPAFGRDGTLYFVRTTLDADRRPIRHWLMRQTERGGEPEVLLRPDDSTPYASFAPMNGPYSVSPDGTMLALTTGWGRDDEPTSLWILDLETGALQQVTTAAALHLHGLPDWMSKENWRSTSLIYGVDWTADSEGIVVVIDNGFFQIRGIMPVAYRVEVATGEIAPWTDFRDVPDNDSFVLTDVTEHPPFPTFYERHDEAIYLRDQGMLIHTNWGGPGHRLGVSAMPAPAAVPARLVAVVDDEYQYMGASSYNNTGTDGEIVRVVLADRLLTFRVR